MKKIFLPILIFIIGLFVAQYFFGVDVEGLIEGFLEFLREIFDGPG